MLLASFVYPIVAAVTAVNAAITPFTIRPPGIINARATPAAVAAVLSPSRLLFNAAAPFCPSYMALLAARPAPASPVKTPAAAAVPLVKF